jgi:short-chain fatty acids transporter
LSGGLADLSSRATFPLFAFLSAGVVNFAIPSGGGQWAVQGDVLLAAGAVHGVAPGATIVAFAHGDAWTNLLQPFWALPLLGVTGLRARDIFGYTAVIAILMGIVVSAVLLALA